MGILYANFEGLWGDSPEPTVEDIYPTPSIWEQLLLVGYLCVHLHSLPLTPL